MRVITAFRLLTITTIFQISSTTNPQFGIVPLPNISVCTPLRTNQQYFVAEPTPCVKKQLTHKNQCNIQLFEPSLSHIKIKAFACSMTIQTFRSVFYLGGGNALPKEGTKFNTLSRQVTAIFWLLLKLYLLLENYQNQ